MKRVDAFYARVLVRLISEAASASQVPTHYRGCEVRVRPGSYFKNADYFAMWELDDDLTPVLFIESRVADAIKDGRLNPTEFADLWLEHERSEALLALRLAQRAGRTREYCIDHFTGHWPVGWQELYTYGGDAHETLEKLHPGGAAAYRKLVDRDQTLVYGPVIKRGRKK
jgi:hypothetical protein